MKRLSSFLGIRLSDLLKYRRLAVDAEDAVSLCETISRRYEVELTLEQADKLMKGARRQPLPRKESE